MRWGGRLIVAVLLLIMIAATLGRIVGRDGDPPGAAGFGVRYLSHPGVTYLHIVPGIAFLLLAPLQFSPGLRARRIGLHRMLGRSALVAGFISGSFAMALGLVLPAYGGFLTLSATVVFGVIYLTCLALAYRHIRRFEIHVHREWMIRAFALGLGVATIRLLGVLLSAVGGMRFIDAFGPSFWLGFSLNLLVAEVWIRRTRATRIP